MEDVSSSYAYRFRDYLGTETQQSAIAVAISKKEPKVVPPEIVNKQFTTNTQNVPMRL